MGNLPRRRGAAEDRKRYALGLRRRHVVVARDGALLGDFSGRIASCASAGAALAFVFYSVDSQQPAPLHVALCGFPYPSLTRCDRSGLSQARPVFLKVRSGSLDWMRSVVSSWLLP